MSWKVMIQTVGGVTSVALMTALALMAVLIPPWCVYLLTFGSRL